MTDKVFYKLSIDNTQDFTDFCRYVNALNECNISSHTENAFAYYIGMKEMLVSINKNDINKHEEILMQKKIGFEKLELEKEYQKYLDENYPVKEKLEDSFLDKDQINVIEEIRIPQIIEGPRGQQLLIEEKVAKEDGIKIYTHSNEQTGHNIPHVHIEYNNDRNFCVISLIDFSVIEPKKSNFAKIKKCVELVKKYCQKCRQAWNKTSGRIKFRTDSYGIPTDETYDTKK